MAAVEMSRRCNIIWEWGIKVISLKNCSLSQGTVRLNADIYFWWTLFDPWVLVLVGCWGSGLVSQDAPALAFQLRARFGFGSDSASRAPWALICCQSSCQVETQHLLPESTQRRHCRRRPWSVGPGWNDSSETAQKRWFVETWFSPQTSVSAAPVAVVRLGFLRFHFHESSALQVCSVAVSSLECADSQEGHAGGAAGASPHGSVCELSAWGFAFPLGLRNKTAETKLLSEQTWFRWKFNLVIIDSFVGPFLAIHPVTCQVKWHSDAAVSYWGRSQLKEDWNVYRVSFNCLGLTRKTVIWMNCPGLGSSLAFVMGAYLVAWLPICNDCILDNHWWKCYPESEWAAWCRFSTGHKCKNRFMQAEETLQ